MTEEHKQKIKEGRERARQERLEQGLPLRQKKTKKIKEDKFVNGKPVVYITGNEETGFDFWKAIRKALRPIGWSKVCDFITREIVKPEYWQDVNFIKKILDGYVHLVVIDSEKKKKRTRKPGSYVMTEEHKAKLKAAREAKKMKLSA